jgi:hypothetical protein
MDKKTYAEQQRDLCQAWASYASKGDTHSAMIVDKDVRGYMADHQIKDYGEALKLRRSEVRALELDLDHAPSASSHSGSDMEAGEELDKIAKKNRELDPTLSYTAALRLACLENPRLASRYLNRDVRADQVELVQEHFSKVHETRKYDYDTGPTNYQVIANIITGIRKTDAHRLDIEAVLRAVNSYGGDTLAQAARERLDVLTRDEINQSGEPASEINAPGGGGRSAIRSRVELRYPEVVAVANGGDLNERSLRQIYPQLMK